MIKVVGAKGNIQDVDVFLKKIRDFAREHDIVVQVFNADLVFGKNHLLSAVNHAVRSHERKTNTTKSLDMEILLYASGERQLKLAIPKMGVKSGKVNIAFVFVDDIQKASGSLSDQKVDQLVIFLNIKRDDSVLNGDVETLKEFGITSSELKTVAKAKYGDLILEKVARVDIIK
jgi:KEOPS complex subunit Cgi121